MKTIALISCSAKKAETPTDQPGIAAKELYQGELFKKARRLVEARGLPWFILSAKHGLIGPDYVLRQYNYKLTRLAEAEAWAEEVAEAFFKEHHPSTVDKIEIYAGEFYFAPLGARLESMGYKVILPLLGLSIGHAMRRLNELFARHEQAFI